MAAMPVMRRGLRWALAGLVVLGVSCVEPQGTEPASGSPAFGKTSAGTSLTVTATDPSYGDQGTISLDVHVLGSGFDRGSRASWEKNGVPYTKITVNSTTFESSGDLLANITIASDAAVDFYDVAVYTSTGKKGIGTELFTVTTAHPFPTFGTNTSAKGINDAGQVTGASVTPGPKETDGFVWDPATSTLTNLGPGTPWDIDQAGVTVVGGRGGTVPLIWSSSGGTWSAGTLPAPAAGAAARALASDGTGRAFVVSGFVLKQVDRKTTIQLPVAWTRSGATWVLDTLQLGASLGQAVANDVTATGIFAGSGNLGSAFYAVVWESATALPALLPAAAPGYNNWADAINPAGTIVVGHDGYGSTGGPSAVMWYRAAPGGPWSGPVHLDPVCGSTAHDVNDAGTVVGQACGQAVAWKTSGGAVLAELLLGGLGKVGDNSWAEGINASGTASGTVGNTGVTWFGF